jgi:hypothetical protein
MEGAMTNDTSYEHYRRDEAEPIERLDEQRRAADAAAQWERIRQFMRARGFLGEFESNLGDLHRYRIRWERKRGLALRAARSHADDLIARVKTDDGLGIGWDGAIRRPAPSRKSRPNATLSTSMKTESFSTMPESSINKALA